MGKKRHMAGRGAGKDLIGLEISFASGLKYIVGKGFVRDNVALDRGEWEKELRRMWEETGWEAQREGRIQGNRRRTPSTATHTIDGQRAPRGAKADPGGGSPRAA